MSSKPRVHDSGTRVLRVLGALQGHSLDGLSNSDLARGLNESPANITRCMVTLIEAGWAVRLDNGRFAPGMKALQFAQSHANEMASMQNRINEINQRVLAGASR